MKKILVVYNYFSTNKGSYSNRYYEFSKVWLEKGYEVEFITSPYFKSDIESSKFFEVQYIEGIKLNVINLPDGGNKPLYKRLINSFGFILIASIMTLFKKYDLLICSSGPFTLGIPNLINILLKKNGIKIFEVRDIWPQSGIEFGLIKNKIIIQISRYYEKLQYKFSDYVVTLSVGQEEYLKKNHPAFSNKIHTISQISNTELFNIKVDEKIRKKYFTKYGKILIYIGGLGTIHNVFYWIKLCNEINTIHKEKFSMIIIGDGPDRKKLEKLKESFRLKNVFFFGQITKSEIPFWLNLSYANLFSTTDMPIQQTCAPNKVFDSFSAGIPLIQTTNGWIKNYLKKTNCGISVDINNVKKSSVLVSQFLNDDKKRNIQAKNSFLNSKKYEKNFLAQKYLKLLDNENS